MRKAVQQVARQNLQQHEKIDYITQFSRPFIKKAILNLSDKNSENVNIIYDYLVAEQSESNIKISTKNGKIVVLLLLSKHFDHRKTFLEMSKQDIQSHLNSLRTV
ncbi:MAG: hypothetical protein R3321_08515, partial [Nitrososphaeraceae archaeon]|nr:hypothetical protein [Nitrososphaeraceae archaeon]